MTYGYFGVNRHYGTESTHSLSARCLSRYAPREREPGEEIIAAQEFSRPELEREALVALVKNRQCSDARAMIALPVWQGDRVSLTDLGKRSGRDLCRPQSSAQSFARTHGNESLTGSLSSQVKTRLGRNAHRSSLPPSPYSAASMSWSWGHHIISRSVSPVRKTSPSMSQ